MGSIVESVGGVIGGITGSTAAAEAAESGARQAGAASLAATEKNIDFQKWLWGEQTALQQPFMEAGIGGLEGYQSMLEGGFQPESYLTDPGYEFRLGEGQKAIEGSAAARGMQLSGSNLKDITRFSQDYASAEYGNAYNRWQQDLSNQFNLAQMGQSAASNVGAAGGQMGSRVGQSILSGGQAESQMYSNIGNIQAGAAMAPWNTVMDIGQMAASAYGGGGGGAPATGGAATTAGTRF